MMQLTCDGSLNAGAGAPAAARVEQMTGSVVNQMEWSCTARFSISLIRY